MGKRTGVAGVIMGFLGGCVAEPTPTVAPLPLEDTRGAPAPAAVLPSPAMGPLLTAERAAQGRGPLVESARLSAAAQAHADDMVAQSYFSHTGADGSQFTARARAAGYGCVMAENIAFGQRSAQEVVAVWMNSAGHRRNILLPDAREFGIGRAGTMWVLMLGGTC